MLNDGDDLEPIGMFLLRVFEGAQCVADLAHRNVRCRGRVSKQLLFTGRSGSSCSGCCSRTCVCPTEGSSRITYACVNGGILSSSSFNFGRSSFTFSNFALSSPNVVPLLKMK